MQTLQEVHAALTKLKQEKKELMKMKKDELSQHQRHCELCEELTKMKLEKQGIEDQVLSKSQGTKERLNEIASELQAYAELLSDIALNMYMKNETVELVDEYDVKYVPVFSVKFKKD